MEVQSEHQEYQRLLEGAATGSRSFRSSAEQPADQRVRQGQDYLETSSAGHSSNPVRVPGWKGPKMQPYQEEEDIEHYLTTFERIATACQWPREEWALHLAPLLNGKAHAAYVAMDIDETMNYVMVKKAILEKYEISTETYRLRFRSTTREEEETPRELQTCLKDLYDKWMVPRQKTKEQIGDAIVMEQFLRVLSPDLRTWVKERNPSSSRKAAEMAEAFLAARRPLKSYIPPRTTPVLVSVSKTVGGNGQRFRNLKQGSPSTTSSRVREFKQRGPLLCHSCGQSGHFKADCPEQSISKTYLCCSVESVNYQGDGMESLTSPTAHERTMCVFIGEKPCVALLDSGSSRTLVRQDCLPRDFTCSGKMKVWCVHGDSVDYPLANVNITVEGQQYLLSVGVMSKLPYQVVLGWDLPILRELISKGEEKDICVPCGAMMAVTRSRHREHQGEPGLDWNELPFAGCDVPEVEGAQQFCAKKSRVQRRQDKVRGTRITELVPEPDGVDIMVVPSDIVQLQRQDPSLTPLFAKCVPSSMEVTEKVRELFLLQDDQLYCRSKVGDQLVVPKRLKPIVLQLAHSVPWSGHLGQFKTFSRMLTRFYWPQQYADTVQFCKSCPQCQLTAPGNKSDRAQLINMPVIDTPFSRIAMDIVGPLERSSAGHRYILVVCDYATRYPEAFPLRKVKARQIANCLIQMFSRVGIPKEIITDQGSNFTSNLLREVYKLLGIRGVKTSPYHPQTDGLVERFNKTLKSMLRKFVEDSGADWDQWLPFLLFAYREVPQASTGFSPFQLLYGHAVRGPLDVLKEAWEGPKPEETCNVLSYVLKMRQA
uniref:Gypsy retrotransposon integrase-like protein 1 n=2 Tax=Acanthochromis polyacanthus TaxID=80966 RepID=A0A3Q1F2Z4_9TELE